jgi:hypothetical protein
MLDIIVLYFLLKKIGMLAKEKGVSSVKWKIFAVLSWFVFEGIGVDFALAWAGLGEIKNVTQFSSIILTNPGIMLFAYFCAFGGYLLVRYILERKPNSKEA